MRGSTYITVRYFILTLTYPVYVVDCKWGDYSEWSSCSQTCGGGEKSRTRSKETQAENGGSPCTGDETDKQSCNPDACPG